MFFALFMSHFDFAVSKTSAQRNVSPSDEEKVFENTGTYDKVREDFSKTFDEVSRVRSSCA